MCRKGVMPLGQLHTHSAAGAISVIAFLEASVYCDPRRLMNSKR